ncbi:hypothetical protein [Streptomyces sp. NPDC056069]|uniref:hypothetical protein n=1 Tax=Streptomyces sp. NPDC056069 TaxID=3345702 RepID=UPI0035DFBF99
MSNTSVSVELTPDGYTVPCPSTYVTGHGPTETAAWNDFWTAYRAQWKPPTLLTGPRRPEQPAAPTHDPHAVRP